MATIQQSANMSQSVILTTITGQEEPSTNIDATIANFIHHNLYHNNNNNYTRSAV